MAACCRRSRCGTSRPPEAVGGRTRGWRLALPAAAVGLLAACQPLPHPFADDAPKPGAAILALPDSTSIWVAPVVGTPQATAQRLAAAIAKALRHRQIAASDNAAGFTSNVLHGRIQEMPASGGAAAVVARWRLDNAKGRFLGERAARIPGKAAAWETGEAGAVTRLATVSAEELVSLIEGGPPPAEAKAKVAQTRLQIAPITGAPGDGAQSLARAIAEVLKRPGLTLVAGPAAKPDLVLDAAVTVGKPAAGKQHIRIVWRLRRADGKEVGTVGQENDVPAGLLDGAWGNVAWSVAVAAEGGIAQLVARAPARGEVAAGDRAGTAKTAK
ncbi:MAG: hypothetical protein ACREE4_21825 [Stellaceae bacterium]